MPHGSLAALKSNAWLLLPLGGCKPLPLKQQLFKGELLVRFLLFHWWRWLLLTSSTGNTQAQTLKEIKGNYLLLRTWAP